jgi:hypothetical protein
MATRFQLICLITVSHITALPLTAVYLSDANGWVDGCMIRYDYDGVGMIAMMWV